MTFIRNRQPDETKLTWDIRPDKVIRFCSVLPKPFRKVFTMQTLLTIIPSTTPYQANRIFGGEVFD
jgi:hypothetical protein